MQRSDNLASQHKDAKCTFRCSRELLKSLRLASVHADRTMEEIITEALDRYLKEKRNG